MSGREKKWKKALAKELNELKGESFLDLAYRFLYATDASHYEILPLGVVYPKGKEDLERLIQIARRYRIPLIPRGAGTSLAGNAVGQGLVIDFRKHFSQILEVNLDKGYVEVQPGVVLEDLNQVLAKLGYFFPIDVATGNRAVLGGQVANNSSGARSIAYGKTQDHVFAIEAVFPNGEMAWVFQKGEKNFPVWQRKLVQWAKESQEEIQKRYPFLLRRVQGYNLDAYLDPSAGLVPILVGSEGSLALFATLRLRILPLPKRRDLGVFAFTSLEHCLLLLPCIVDTFPSAVELLDEVLLKKAYQNPYFRPSFLKGVSPAVLIVEFEGEERKETKAKLEQLRQKLLPYLQDSLFAFTEEKKREIWRLRKAALPLLASGRKKAQTGVEDTAVPLEKLAIYVQRFQKLLEKHNTYASFYGHASVGCLHIRPFFDLERLGDRKSFQILLEEVVDLVLEMGGALSGEHGDGRARSYFLPRLFGKELYEKFCQVKELFDPLGVLNPAVIVHPEHPLENLRYSRSFRSITTGLFYKEGGFDKALRLCTGVGACLKKGGFMCPSYQVLFEEAHSTRGRANLLRFWLYRGVARDGKALYDSLKFCLMCEGCKAECPAQVDLAKYKAEFLWHYHRRKGRSLFERGILFLPEFLRLAEKAKLLPLVHKVARWLLPWTGVPPSLWSFLTPKPQSWGEKERGKPLSSCKKGEVFLLLDTFTNFFHPQAGVFLQRMLEWSGWRVRRVPFLCCGRVAYSKGDLTRARRYARQVVETLLPRLSSQTVVTCLEPSCFYMMRDYEQLLGGNLDFFPIFATGLPFWTFLLLLLRLTITPIVTKDRTKGTL